MARLLITGANGQLAPAIIRRLAASGHSLLLMTRQPNAIGERPADAMSCVLPAPWSVEALRDIMIAEEVTGIVNLAAAGVRPHVDVVGALYDTNVALTVNLLRAGASHIRYFVNLGSGAEYAGDATAALDENAPLSTTHAYGMSKAASGLAGLQVAHETGCAFAHLRLFGAYGEHEAPHRLLPNLVERLSRGEAVPLSDGLQIRDWLYEADIADAIARTRDALGDGTLPSGIYNLGSGQGATVRAFAETVADLMAVPHTLLEFGRIPRRGKEVDALVANTASLHGHTGWRPRHNLREGLAEAIHHYRIRLSAP